MQFSTRYIDHYAKYVLGDTGEEGATQLACARAMKGKGACREGLWPQCCEKLSSGSLKLANRDAFNRRSAFYQRCYDIDDIKYSMSKFSNSLTFSFKIFESIDKDEKYGVIPLPNKDEKQIDLHSVLLVGYNDNLELLDGNENLNKGFFTFLNS